MLSKFISVLSVLFVLVATAGILYLFVYSIQSQIDTTSQRKARCDNECFPAKADEIFEGHFLIYCVCGPYTENGKPRYELKTLDGGSQ